MWFVFIFLLALFSSASGSSARRHLHYLELSDPSDPSLTESEMEKYDGYLFLWNFLDGDEDGKILLSDIESNRFLLSETGESVYIKKPELRRLLCHDPPLMNEDVFEDLWWILNYHLTQELEDYTELLFNYIDTNADGFVDDKELRSIIKNAGRTEKTPQIKTVFRSLIESLDADKSGGLDHSEIWMPITQLIKTQNDVKGILVEDFAQLCQNHANLTADVLDFDQLALCLDANLDDYISIHDEKDLVTLLDRNYNKQIDEFEMKNVKKDLQWCIDERKQEKEKSRRGAINDEL